MRFDKENSKDVCTQQDFEKIIDKSAIEQIYQPEKFPFIIDLEAFMSLCYELNMILSSYGYFLRAFELKKKFCHLSVKSKDNQKIVRQLSSCLIEKFNGFTIISIEYQKKNKEKHLNQSISFTNQQKKLKYSQFVIFQMIFQKHFHLYIQTEKEI